MSGMILVRPERCLACKRCRVACRVAHSRSADLVAAISERPRPAARIALGASATHVVPTACRHCADAACLLVCRTGAIRRDGPGSPVILERRRCVGCQDCMLACPYGVPRLTADRTAVVKCDLCIERLERGAEPACTEACPTGAIVFRGTPETEPTGLRPPDRRDAERPAVETAGDGAG